LTTPDTSKIKVTKNSERYAKDFPLAKNAEGFPLMETPLSASCIIRNIFKNRIQLKISAIVNGWNLVMSTKVNSKPPIRLPIDSRIYTKPISAAESCVNPLITLHPMGKINPIVKLKGVIIHNEESSNDNIGMY
jgi:hypothetical protein